MGVVPDAHPAAPSSRRKRILRVEECLLAKVARREPGAAEAMLDRFGDLVWSLARRRCATRDEAEDAVQEIMLDLWKSAERYRPEVASETTFVAMIARRRLIDRGRRARLAIAQSESDVPVPQTVSGFEELEDAAIAMSALSTLGADNQQVIRMSIVNGMSHDEIARATGMPIGSVKTCIRRGLLKVREAMQLRHGRERQEVAS